MAADTRDAPADPASGRSAGRKTSRSASRWRRLVGIVSLAALLANVAVDAIGWLDWGFLTSPPHPNPYEAGFFPP